MLNLKNAINTKFGSQESNSESITENKFKN